MQTRNIARDYSILLTIFVSDLPLCLTRSLRVSYIKYIWKTQMPDKSSRMHCVYNTLVMVFYWYSTIKKHLICVISILFMYSFIHSFVRSLLSIHFIHWNCIETVGSFSFVIQCIKRTIFMFEFLFLFCSASIVGEITRRKSSIISW